MYLVRSGAFYGFEKLVSRYGGNPVELIHDAGFSLAQFRNPNSYIAFDKVAYLLERCAQVSQNPLFALELSHMDNLTVLGDLPITAAQESTVGKALIFLNRHLYLVASGVHVRIEELQNEARISLHFDFSSPLGIDQLVQKSVADTAGILFRMTNIERSEILIQLRQLEPANVETAKKLAFNKIDFSADFDGLIIPVKTLKQETRIDEASMQLHFKEQLHFLSQRYPGNLENQIKEIIGQLLPSSECTIARVAANLNMHPRMLQIKLQAKGTTFGALLRETRQSIAEQHLQYDLISITELALTLGFADVAVFSRQFKSWTGYSPREWKRSIRSHKTIS